MSEWTNFNNVDDIFRSSTEGLPDNHVITVRERYLDVDIPELIQNNIKTDTITLDLDAEWEGITPVIILGSADDAVEVYYNGEPVTIPSQVAKEVGWVDCSVTGYDATGTVRLVTVAAPDTFQVIESGLYTGEVPEEEGTSLLGQLLDAAKDAQAAADSAEDKIETIDTKLTEVDTKLTEVDTKLTEVDTKLTEVDTEVDTKLTEVDTKVVELTTVAGNAQKAAQNAQTAAETAQKAAEDAENSVTDAIFMDATDEKPGEKFFTDADGNVLQDVYLTTANGVGDKEQYINIGRSGEINGVAVHGGRAHAQLWTRASADGQHDAYLNMYDTLDDGTLRSVLQAGYQNENTHVKLWDRDNPDARSGSFQPNRLVMADIENDAQADFKPTVGYFDSSGSQAIIKVSDPGENGINAVMGFGNSGTGKVLSRIGVTDGTSVLELNDHTVNDISLDSFADAENPSNKNLVTEKAVKAAIDAIPEALPEGGTEGQVLTKTAGGKAWQDIPEALPEGGTTGQVLSKTDSGTAWVDAPEADMTNVAKIVGNQLVSYDGSSIDYVNVRGESSDSYGRVSGMGGIGFVSAGTGNDFIRLKSDSSGQCIGIRKEGVDTEYTISDTISETENTLATGKAVKDAIAAIPKPDLSRVVKLNDETNNANFADGSGRVEGITIRPVNNGHTVSTTVNVADGQSTGGYVSVGSNTDGLGMYVTDHPFIRHVVDGSVTDYTISDEISEGTNTLATGKAVADYVEAQTKKNVLVSTATGKVAHAEDAFAEKPREVRIKGKTWKNLWSVINSTTGGVTASTDATGLITVSGTPTSPVFLTNNQNFMVAPGASMSYLVSNVELFNASSRPYVQFYDADGANVVSVSLNAGNSLTVPNNASEARCYIAVYPTAPINASFRIMLVEGSEVPDCFVPTGVHGVEPTKLVTAGKNLIDLSRQENLAYTYQDDGTVNALPEDTRGWGYASSNIFMSLPPGSYTLSLQTAGADNASNAFNIYSMDGIILRSVNTTDFNSGSRVTRTLTLSHQTDIGVFWKLVGNGTATFQLELGSTTTTYEPPNVTEVALPELNAPLMRIPKYADELVIEEDGSVRVERAISTYVVKGTEKVSFNYSTRTPQFRTTGIGASRYASTAIICDKLPSQTRLISDRSGCGLGPGGTIYFNVAGVTINADTGRAWLYENKPTFWLVNIDNFTTEQLGTVSIPALPAPTFNVCHDSDVPSDTSVTYENDVNITISNMQKTIDALLGGN